MPRLLADDHNAVGITVAYPRLPMADSDSDQKTEQATERHLKEAFEQGRFAKVPELTVLLMMVAG